MNTETAQNQGGEMDVDSFAAALMQAAPDPETPQDDQPEVAQEQPQEDVEEVAAEADETDAEQPDEDQPTLYAVTINGQESQVGIDDLIAGYQKSGNYDQRIAQVKQDREAVKAQMAEVEQMKAQVQERLAQFATPDPEPDWVALADELDPYEFNRQRAEWDKKQAQKVVAARELREQQNADFAKAQSEAASKLREAAKLTTPEAAKAYATNIQEGASHYGFTTDDVQNCADHRLLMILHDAQMYRQSLEAKPASKKVAKPAKAMPPGAAKPANSKDQKSKDALSAFRNTGSEDDFVKAMLSG